MSPEARARSLEYPFDFPFDFAQGFGSPELRLTGMMEGFFRSRRRWAGAKDPSGDFTMRSFRMCVSALLCEIALCP